MAYTTRRSLLAKVRNGDETSWQEFYDTYANLIRSQGYRCDLSDMEREELVQQVMSEIFLRDIIGKYDPDNVPADVIFKYDPAKGRFRHYLSKIAYYQAIKIIKKRRYDISTDADDFYEHNQISVDTWNAAWDDEWRQHALHMAMVELRGRVQPETFVAFEMYAIQNRKVEEVADFLNISVSSVYTAKSRCVSTLREIVKDLEDK